MAAMAGFPCAARVSSLFPGYTCSSQPTVVGCHVGNFGKGISTKTTDMAVIAGCAHCHAIIDGVDRHRRDFIEVNYSTAYVNRLLMGLIETHARLVAAGIITVKGYEP
jgi:hypothetical protein